MYAVYQSEHVLHKLRERPSHFDKNGTFFEGEGAAPHSQSSRIPMLMFGSVSMDRCLVLLVVSQCFNFLQDLGTHSLPELPLL